MKTFFFALLLSFAPFFAGAQIKSAELTASGLTCSMCSKSIYKALEKLSFVDKIIVDVRASKYNISFKPGVAVPLDELKKAVEGAGFSVARLDVTAGFSGVAVQNEARVSLPGSNLRFLGVQQQTLSGDKTFTVVDKGFLLAKEQKKYAGLVRPSTGSSRVYSVTL